MLTENSVVRGKYDQYTVIKKIGEGGMGQIWSGISGQGREVVIKSLKVTGDGNDDHRIKSLDVEAKILKDLSSPGHPQILKYIDESKNGNSLDLVIEKINGPTFMEHLIRNPLDEPTALNYLGKILSALDYVHKKNIIHRDMKPNNIILDPQRGPILFDFGGSKRGYALMQPSQQSMTGMTQIGTVGWTCPEQIIEGKVDTSCDIYGIGTTMFYMLTGKNPSMFMDQTGKINKSPHELNSTISLSTSMMVQKAIDPNHRVFTTADDMISFLQKQTIPYLGRPHIILQGVKYELVDELVIGRKHVSCDAKCRQFGFSYPPKIQIMEIGTTYISKHHVRIWKDRQGYCWIQDLRSTNSTAIYKNGAYRILAPGQKEMLLDNSSVAICYNSTMGAYITFTFHER